MDMSRGTQSWLARRIETAVRVGLSGAYKNVRINPAKYLVHLRRAYDLPIASFREMRTLPLPLIEHMAGQTIAASRKFAMAEGASLGIGGILTIVPDVGVLTTIAIRMIQRLSLIYGFEYSTEDEMAELWLAAASAAGLDLGREMFEKEVLERLVPRIIEGIAVKAGSEVAEKWAARLIPVLSSVLGGTLNYYFIRGWGRRAQRHFRERHLLMRDHLELARLPEANYRSAIVRQPLADEVD
ncbi:MAG TPA: EcsC family protein [Terriglobia bacterium]|nr:EcsC family protein [Terriglobia bacterium]